MITDLRLQNFRSYIDSSFELSPSVNIIVGPNASGKTNLLEAVLVIATGSSYRAKDPDLISFKKPWARLDIDTEKGGHRTVKIQAEPETTKTYEIDDKPYKRLSHDHSIPVVLFEPNHLLLLSGGPERRRSYMDELLEQTQPGYGLLTRQYKRTLAQRNNLLKHSHGEKLKSQVFPWDLRLSQLAGQIVRARTDLINSVSSDITGLYKKLSKTKTNVTIQYNSQWPSDNYESRFLKKLELSLATDQQRGFTANGPHREDFVVYFDGHESQETASRGEARTVVLSLKILELKTISNARNTTPLLLLDDVFSELDGSRRHALTDFLAPYQTFITTTDADLVLQHFTEKCNVIPLG